MIFKKYEKKNEDGSVDVGVSNIFKLKKQAAEEVEQAFTKQMSVINADIALMKRYENGLHTTTDKGKLFSATLGKASEAAQKQAGAIQNGTMTTEVWGKKQSDAAKSAKELGKQSQIASLKATALSVAMNVGLSLAITAVFKLIEYATQANARYVQSQEKIIETANKNISNWDLEKSKIESLQKSLLDAKGNKEKLWAISNDLNGVIGETPGLIDGEAGAWERANTQLAIQLDLLDKWITRANDQKVEANRNIFEQKTYENEFVAFKDNKGFFSGGLDRNEIIEEAKRVKAEAEAMYQLPWDEIIEHEKYGASLYINNAKTRLGELDGYLNEFSSYAKEILSGILDDSDLNATGKQIVNTSIDDMVRNGESIDAINESAKHLIEGYKSISEEQTKLVEASQNGEDTSPFIASIEKQFDELIEKVPAAKTTIEKFYQDLKNSIAGNIQTLNQSPDLSSLALEEANKLLDETQSKYQSLAKSIEDYNSTGIMTIDNMQAIIGLGNEYLQFLSVEDGQIKMNREGLVQLALARIDDAEAAYLQEAANLVSTLTDEKTASDFLKKSTEDEAKARLDNAEAAWEEAHALAATNAAKTGSTLLAEAIKTLEANVGNAKYVFDEARNSIGSYTDTTMGAASATSKLSDAQKELEDSLRAEGEAAIRVIDRKIKAIQEAQKASEKDIDSQIDKIKEEKEAYEDAIDAEIDALNKRKEALQESISKYEDAASVVVDFIDKQMDAINDRKDEINDFYNEQLEALDKTNKALQDQIDREKSLEALEKARSQKVMVLKDGEFGYAVDEGAVKDAQDSHDQLLADQALQAEKDRIEAEREEKLNALEDETKRWEDYKKLWSDATSAYEREQQLLHALEVLGKDWENDILNQRTDVLNQFTEHHYNQTKALEENVLTQIDTLTKQKEDEAILFEERIEALEEQKVREAENYAARIEDLNGYKERVQERLNMIGQSWEEYQTQLDLEAKWEAALFDGMAAEIEDYADRVEEAMRRAQAAKAKGGAGGSPKSPSNDDYDYRNDSSLTAGQKKQAALAEKEFGGYAAGGTVYKTGIYKTDELGDEIIVPKPKRGKFQLLEMGDKIIGSAMSRQIMQSLHGQSNALVTKHFTVPMKALNLGVFGAPQSESTTHINVHNITLPNVRTGEDAQKIVDELRKLPIKAHQHTQSMRFGK